MKAINIPHRHDPPREVVAGSFQSIGSVTARVLNDIATKQLVRHLDAGERNSMPQAIDEVI